MILIYLARHSNKVITIDFLYVQEVETDYFDGSFSVILKVVILK
jgi:hypothetical protein